MKLYYFYAPSKYRANHRKHNTIGFELAALYGYKAYSQKLRREVTSFSYVDQVDCFVNTKTTGHYAFEFDHGKDGCQGHYATSYKELCAAQAESGFMPLKESDYFRLRKLAVKLLFRHTDFNRIWLGRSEYYFSNETGGGNFYDITLAAFNYQHNRKREPYDFHVWKLNNLTPPLYDVMNTEIVKVFIHRNKLGDEKYDTYKFEIKAANPHLGAIRMHQSFERGADAIFYRKDYQNITLHQYERLRKILKHLIWEHSDVDVKPLKRKQEYAVTILDI